MTVLITFFRDHMSTVLAINPRQVINELGTSVYTLLVSLIDILWYDFWFNMNILRVQTQLSELANTIKVNKNPKQLVFYSKIWRSETGYKYSFGNNTLINDSWDLWNTIVLWDRTIICTNDQYWLVYEVHMHFLKIFLPHDLEVKGKKVKLQVYDS